MKENEKEKTETIEQVARAMIGVALMAVPKEDYRAVGSVIVLGYAYAKGEVDIGKFKSEMAEIIATCKPALVSAWGSDYEENRVMALVGRLALDLTDEEIDELYSALGHKRLMEMLLDVGLYAWQAVSSLDLGFPP